MTPRTYACCVHCEHDDVLDGPHDTPCDEGCNDRETAATAGED